MTIVVFSNNIEISSAAVFNCQIILFSIGFSTLIQHSLISSSGWLSRNKLRIEDNKHICTFQFQFHIDLVTSNLIQYKIQ